MTPALATAPRPRTAAGHKPRKRVSSAPRPFNGSADELPAYALRLPDPTLRPKSGKPPRPTRKLTLRRPPRMGTPAPLPGEPAGAATSCTPERAPASAGTRPQYARPANPRTPDADSWDRFRMSVPYPGSVEWDDVSVSLLTPLPPDAPDLRKTAALLGAACIDVLLGRRNIVSLRPWLATDVFSALERRTMLALRIKGRAPAGQHGRIKSVHSQAVHARAHELTLVAHDGERFRAIAMRLEFWHARWRVMALEIG